MSRRETVTLQLFRAGRPVGNPTTIDVDPADAGELGGHLAAAMSRERIKPERVGECCLELRYPHNGWLARRFVTTPVGGMR